MEGRRQKGKLLTSVFSTEDDHLLLGEVDGNGCGRGHSAGEPVGRESTSVVDDIVGVEVLKLLSRWADQHVAHKEGVVGASADNTNAYPVAFVPSCETVDNVDALAGIEVVNGTLTVDAPDLRTDVSKMLDAHVMAPSRMQGWSVLHGEMRGAELEPRHVQGHGPKAPIGYVPSAYDVCHQIHEPFAANSTRIRQDDRKAEECTYIGIHRLVDRTPPDLVLRRVLLDDTLI